MTTRAKTQTPPAAPDPQTLPDAALDEVAAFFQALAEPSRLRLLNLLREGERKVGDLALLAQSTAANVSRHLSLLQARGLVTRTGRGTSVYYAIADPAIYQLCDLVCDRMAQRHAQRARAALAAGY